MIFLFLVLYKRLNYINRKKQFFQRTEDSSAFEHVFVGEERSGKTVLGCHNWIDYYFLQQKGQIDYKGYYSDKTIVNNYMK